MYDCTHPDLLVSLFVPANGSNCTRLRTLNQFYTIAYFGIDMTNSGLLGRHPAKVDFIYLENSNSANTAASATSTFCSVSCIIVIYKCE